MTIKRKTHCKYGHELTEENTYQVYHKNGAKNGRRCRLCTKTEKTKEYKARKAREYYAANPEKFKEIQTRYKRNTLNALPRVFKTHCWRGHELTEANVYQVFSKEGKPRGRGCKICKNMKRSENHCSKGHEFTEDNTYAWISKQGHKVKRCKICTKRKNDGRAAQLRDGHLQRKYGITSQQFDEMLKEQGDRCFLCQTDIPGGMGSFAVDHCHVTLKLRKLLCYNCNTVLGKINDDAALLRKMADYIESYT